MPCMLSSVTCSALSWHTVDNMRQWYIITRVVPRYMFYSSNNSKLPSCKLQTIMPSNVEIKAHLRQPDFVRAKAQELSGSAKAELLHQTDTFFHCPNGRLKLREFKEDPSKLSQLVFYSRMDTSGPKLSQYSITESHHPDELKATLALALGVQGIVQKTRTLVMVGHTRVHIDEVQDLGSFMELEVQIQPGQTVEEGTNIADDLMEKLGIQPSDLVSGAYMDLILQRNVNGEDA